MKNSSLQWIAIATALLCSYSPSALSQHSPVCYQTPIVLDLGKDGIELGPAGVGVYFDNNANGVAEHLQWVKSGGDEGFLALDRNANGIVDDGSELFGNGTPCVLEGGTTPNGFVGLAQYDSIGLGGNDDGLISSADAIWNQLRLWVDVNADGKSVPAEMYTLETYELVALPTIPKLRDHLDSAGNRIPYFALAITAGSPAKLLVVDVYFLMIQ